MAKKENMAEKKKPEEKKKKTPSGKISVAKAKESKATKGKRTPAKKETKVVDKAASLAGKAKKNAAGKNNLTEALKLHFGFGSFKGNQEAIVENVLAGKDTFVLMPTGGGKSLCYQLPSLMMEGTALVISPLIALMKNQVDAMRNFSEEDGVAHFINSSLNRAAIEKVKQDILSGRPKTKMLNFCVR